MLPAWFATCATLCSALGLPWGCSLARTAGGRELSTGFGRLARLAQIQLLKWLALWARLACGLWCQGAFGVSRRHGPILAAAVPSLGVRLVYTGAWHRTATLIISRRALSNLVERRIGTGVLFGMTSLAFAAGLGRRADAPPKTLVSGELGNDGDMLVSGGAVIPANPGSSPKKRFDQNPIPNFSHRTRSHQKPTLDRRTEHHVWGNRV